MGTHRKTADAVTLRFLRCIIHPAARNVGCIMALTKLKYSREYGFLKSHKKLTTKDVPPKMTKKKKKDFFFKSQMAKRFRDNASLQLFFKKFVCYWCFFFFATRFTLTA